MAVLSLVIRNVWRGKRMIQKDSSRICSLIGCIKLRYAIITRSTRFSKQQEMKRACTFSIIGDRWTKMSPGSLAVYNRLLDFATKINCNSPTKHRLVSGRQATRFESLGTNDPKVSCVNLQCENNSTRWNCAEQTAFITKVSAFPSI